MLLALSCRVQAAAPRSWELKSPDGAIVVTVTAGDRLEWSVRFREKPLIAPSPFSLTLGNGGVLGSQPRLVKARSQPVSTQFSAIHYRRAVISDVYNQLILNFRGNYGVEFRAYDDAVAYRFFTSFKEEITILSEEAHFNFMADHEAFIPIQWDYRDGKIFNSSFEALYREIRLSEFPADSLAFLPLLVDAGEGVKVELLEADLEDYPGMYLDLNETGKGFRGVFAPYPLSSYEKGRNVIPDRRAGYIARTAGTRSFPWRVAVITGRDAGLLDCDIVQKLASPCRLDDISWIRPGQVSWDWWNDLNISHVDFTAGMNTDTYKYYIDFASSFGISYIILDEGWNVPGDLTRVKPVIDLEELVAYGSRKGVGLILWASWRDILAQKEKAFDFFSAAGIRGLKIDFIDRDDQVAVASTYEIAELAARHKLLVDYHGIFKPTGLQRTYPNVVGYEGVKGMENVKWADEDVPRYDVTIPFIRNLAGPMDYTPGAMRNATQACFRAVNSMPMSKGTRVHQLAMYVVFEVPLQMLADNPTAYLREKECTSFITRIPTVFDESVPLDGKVGEYVAVARKKGDSWYVGAMTDWTPRELFLDFSFLGEGEYNAEIFSDGVNAHRDATDYKRELTTIRKGDRLKVTLKGGGGWAAILEKQ